MIGAGGTLGTAVCASYADAGAAVVAIDLDDASAAATGASAALAADVTDPVAVEEAAERCGPVNSVVYAAGVTFTADVVAQDLDEYRRLMAVNLDGAFAVGRAFGRRMLDAGREGSFCFISSVAGQRGEPGASAYCASKFGLIGLTQSFAAEVATRGIRVNALCPGNVDSPMLRSIAVDVAEREGEDPATVLRRFADVAASRRLIEPSEVAAAVVWLASPAASAITAGAIVVDGGTTTF